jgi:hypothetical protein
VIDPFYEIDRIYCVNLDRRPDRWAKVAAELGRLGLLERVERVPGIEHASGAIGCLESHRECIRRAIACGANLILLLEDDVEFVAEPRAPLRAALDAIAADPTWDALNLGPQCIGPVEARLGPLFRGPMVQSHALVFHRRAFGRALHAHVPVDYWYTRVLRMYGTIPPIAHQARGWSDINRLIQDPRDALERSQRLYLETSWPRRVVGLAYFGLRRRVGHAIVGVARRFGVALRFEGFKPRIDPRPPI